MSNIDFDFYTNKLIDDKLRESHNIFVTSIQDAVGQFNKANMSKRELYAMAALSGLSVMASQGWGMDKIAAEAVNIAKHLEEKLQ